MPNYYYNIKNYTSWLKEKYHRLERNERIAVVLTISAALCGIGFALAAPHLSIIRRIGRIGVDIILLLGVLVYIIEPSRTIKSKKNAIIKAINETQRVVAILITLAATIFIMGLNEIDVYLRVYRLSLSAIILIALITKVSRPIPKKFFAGILIAELVFGTIEFSTIMYVAWTVDGPIAYETMREIGKNIIKGVDGKGITVTPEIGTTIIERYNDLFIYKNNKIYGTLFFKDMMHWIHGDPGATFKIMVDEATVKGPIHFLKTWNHPTQDYHCRMLKDINPPLEGYHIIGSMVMVNTGVLSCAIFKNDKAWEEQILQTISRWLIIHNNILKRDIENKQCSKAIEEAKRINFFFAIALNENDTKDKLKQETKVRIYHQLTGKNTQEQEVRELSRTLYGKVARSCQKELQE